MSEKRYEGGFWVRHGVVMSERHSERSLGAGMSGTRTERGRMFDFGVRTVGLPGRFWAWIAVEIVLTLTN